MTNGAQVAETHPCRSRRPRHRGGARLRAAPAAGRGRSRHPRPRADGGDRRRGRRRPHSRCLQGLGADHRAGRAPAGACRGPGRRQPDGRRSDAPGPAGLSRRAGPPRTAGGGRCGEGRGCPGRGPGHERGDQCPGRALDLERAKALASNATISVSAFEKATADVETAGGASRRCRRRSISARASS